MVNLFMVIDDDPISNLVCERMFKNNQYSKEVISFLRAKDALNYLDEAFKNNMSNKLPDLIFLDLNMPEMGGWEFLDIYKDFPESFRSKCRLFMLSSSIDKDDQIRVKEYPEVLQYITKPLTRANLQKNLHIIFP